jgi:5,10-methylenetetrahydromethanopterin reductase
LLGLGVGGTGFRELGIATRLPVAALRETVDVVRRLLAGERVTVEGKVVSLQEGKLQFTPVRHRIPVYFATHGAQIMKLAGEVADGVLLANTLVPSALGFYVDQLREGQAKSGRSLEELDISLRPEICLDADETAARQVMRRRVAARLIAGYPHWDFLERLDLRLPDRFTEIAAAKDTSRLDEAAASLPDEAVDRTTLAGRPERVADRIAEALRPEITSITVRPHALPGKDVGAVLRAFVEEVVPRIGVAAPSP